MSKMRRSVENAEQVGKWAHKFCVYDIRSNEDVRNKNIGLFAPRMSRDGRRGQGLIRPELQTTPTTTAAAAFLQNAVSPPHRQGQMLSNITPITSPVAQRRGPL